jgi:hypothetical protein
MADRAAIRRRMLARVTVVILIALAFFTWHGLHKPPPTPQLSHDAAIDPTLAAGRAPVSIRSAVLYDCYEHARENVPPRNDTTARSNNWQPPPMPADVIRAASAQKLNSSDAQLLEFLKKWETQYRAGQSLDGIQLAQLTSFLDQTKLSFETLFNLGSAIGFLENASMAAIFHRAALRRANEEYKNLSPLHPAAPMLRAALPQMGMYWNNGDYPLLEQRFKIEMQLYPPLSQESRKCMHSCAEAMFYQGHSREAADLIATKAQRDQEAGDMSASDKQEMGWIVGIFYDQDRIKESIAGLAIAAQSGGGRGMDALRVMASKIGRLAPQEMEEQLAGLESYKLSPEQIQNVRSQAQEMSGRFRTMQAMTVEQRMAQRRAQQVAASQATTRPAMTIEQRLAMRRQIENPSSRPATRPTTGPDEAARLTYWQEQRRLFELDAERQKRAALEGQNIATELRELLKTNPRQAIDRLLNGGDMSRLMAARRFDDVEELGVLAIIAASRDTWQVEQLQRYRLGGFLGARKAKEGLAAARALFNVAGMGSVPHDLASMINAMRFAFPGDAARPNHFRLQQLAGAQSDPAIHKMALAELGENVMASIAVDGAPFKDAIAQRQSATDYDTLYSLGNLLLVSGRISEAREVFEKVYKIAPPGELNYSSEAIAKVIKAEDGSIGRANAFAAAIRPKE